MATKSTKDTEVKNHQGFLVWLPENPVQEAYLVNYVLSVANLLYLGVNGYQMNLVRMQPVQESDGRQKHVH